jgi:hypothetical protein
MEKTLQEKQYEFFRSHLKEFLANAQLKNKFVVVADCEVKGFHDTFAAAYEAALSQFAQGTFIIQQVVDDNASVSFLATAV